MSWSSRTGHSLKIKIKKLKKKSTRTISLEYSPPKPNIQSCLRHGSSIHGRYSNWCRSKWTEAPPRRQDFLSSFPGQSKGPKQNVFYWGFFLDFLIRYYSRALLGLSLVWPSSHSQRGWLTGSKPVVDFLLRITSWCLASHVCPPGLVSYTDILELSSCSKRLGPNRFII